MKGAIDVLTGNPHKFEEVRGSSESQRLLFDSLSKAPMFSRLRSPAVPAQPPSSFINPQPQNRDTYPVTSYLAFLVLAEAVRLDRFG